jgi:hypothetical protein
MVEAAGSSPVVAAIPSKRIPRINSMGLTSAKLSLVRSYGRISAESPIPAGTGSRDSNASLTADSARVHCATKTLRIAIVVMPLLLSKTDCGSREDTTLTCLFHKKRNGLKARVVLYAYPHHVRLLSPEPVVVTQPQSTRVDEPILLCNHLGTVTHCDGNALIKTYSDLTT